MADLADRVARFLARNSRGATLTAVAALTATGWLWLLLAVAGSDMPGAYGIGMAPLEPLIRRLAAALPWLAAGTSPHGALMPSMAVWGAGDVALVLAMWVAMVFAMMLPTAAATFNAYAGRGAGVAAGVIAGYAAVWIVLAAVGTGVQTALTYLGALMPHMAPAGTALSASVLIAAGLYQFTPLKLACLIRCRNPYPSALDGPSARVAFAIGVEEGLACAGCCWAMMAVMFAAGLMNLVAMAFLGALMGFEKLTVGMKTTYFAGGSMLIVGAILASGLFFG